MGLQLTLPNLAMLQAKKSSGTGIVIRRHAVEVISAKRGSRGLKITQFSQTPFSEEGDDAQVVDAIKQAVESSKLRTKDCIVSIPARDVLLRSFTLPLLPKGEWEQAVQFEVRKYIPFKAEELAWGYHAEEQRAQKRVSVVFVGVRQDRYLRIQRWLEGAGLTPLLIEPESVSLARLIPDSIAAPEHECTGIVDVEPDAAHAIIARNRVPYFARDVDLTQELAPPQEPSHEPEAVPAPQTPSADPRSELLLSEVRLSCDYFTRENPQASIARLLVFGDPMIVGPWVSAFGQQLPYPVAVGALPVETVDGLTLGLDHAAAVGLALRSAKPSTGKLEFMVRRAELSAAKRRPGNLPASLDGLSLQRLLGPLIMAAISAFGVTVALSWIENQRVNMEASHMTETVQKFQDVGWGLKDLKQAELQTIQQQTEKRLGFLRRTINQRAAVAERLDSLAKILPDGIWLESIAYQDKLEVASRQPATFTLKASCFLPGSGNELTVIGDFAQKLKHDEKFFRGFSLAQLGDITVAKDDHQRYTYRTFQITCAAAS